VLVPYHVSRDCQVWWEHGRRIKCSGSRTRDRRREALLRSRSIDSLEPLPYLTVAVNRAPADSQDLAPVFEAMVDIKLWRLQV